MTSPLSKPVLFLALRNAFRFAAKISVSIFCASIITGNLSSIAKAESAQITLSLDATVAPTFSALINQAEALAEIEISRRFQADPALNELQITVLGERNGQLVSLLSSKISRSAWQANPDLHQWARYLPTSSVLLGYRNSDPLSTRPPAIASRMPVSELSPSETLEQARLSRRISETEYWRLVDAID